jgi:PAS domain S-box-containing protein
VLVVEDNPVTRQMIRATLVAAGYEVIEAADGRTAIAEVEREPPALVLQDLLLPDISGVQLSEKLRALPGAKRLPIIALTGFLQAEEEAQALAAGFTEYLVKPIEPVRLLEVVRAYVGDPRAGVQAAEAVASGGSAGGRRILVVDDDESQLALTRLHLTRLGYAVQTARDGVEALEMARAAPPEAILSDVLMPRLDGFKLCRAIRQDPGLRHIPVVLQSNHYAEDADREMARGVGANAYVIRTATMQTAAAALRDALATTEPPPLDAAVNPDQSDYSDRIVRILERQAGQNTELLQRTTLQGAALAVLGSTADALARREPVEGLLEDLLYRCIDVAGVSVGVFYLSAAGAFTAHVAAGSGSDARVEAEACFGHPELLQRVLDGQTPQALPAAGAAIEPATADFLERLRQKRCLLVPVLFREEGLGVLLLASNSRDLAAPEWIGFGRVVSGQIGQAIMLSRAFEQLQASQQRLETVIDSALDAVITMDASGRISGWNRRAETIFGWSVAEAIGRSLVETIIPVSLRDRHAEGLRRFLSSGEGSILGRPIEITAMHRTGREFPVELTVTAARLNDTWLFTGFVRDITERKRAEEALRESAERHRALVDHTFDGFVISDRGVVLEANRGFAQIFGYAVEEVIGKSLLMFVAPESREAIQQRLESGTEGQFEALGMRKDGRKIQLETHARSYRHGDRPLRLTAVRDVTERRQLEQQFRQAQKMEAVGRLAGGVAHDFNNLLTVITSYTQILLEDLGGDEAKRADLLEIQKAAHGAATLTNQLLAFSRQQVLEPRVLNLNTIVAGAEKMLQRLIGEDIDLVTALATDLGAVRADPGQVEQVIFNLAVNARDAMPHGGKITLETTNVDVDVEYAQQHAPVTTGQFVLLSMSDTGVGMDADTQSRIFEPFFSTKEKGKGTGLGLATVYGIVKQSGGFIWVYSEPGQGATFKIYLPRVDEPVSPPAPSRPLATAGGTETILIAEDAPGVRGVVHEVLKRQGYTVLASPDGKSALALAAGHSGPIHLLITDVIMPEMSGRQLADRMREIRPDVKVLFVSGYTDDAIVRHGILEPGIAFLQKPFSPTALARKVREVLG